MIRHMQGLPNYFRDYFCKTLGITRLEWETIYNLQRACNGNNISKGLVLLQFGRGGSAHAAARDGYNGHGG